MTRDYTDITIVLDRSGSMAAIRDATVEGLNGFISSQKDVPGDGSSTPRGSVACSTGRAR